MLIVVNNEDFSAWLNDQLKEQGISQSELARRGGISRSAVNKALDPTGYVGWDVCYGIAQALGLPPILVFRKAGLLPAKRSDNDLWSEASILFEELEREDQEEIIEMMKMKYRRAQLKSEARLLADALENIPPDRVDEIVKLIDNYMRSVGARRVQ